MEARHQYGHAIRLGFGLCIALVMLWASLAQAQGDPDRILYRINAGGPRIDSVDRGPDWLPDDGFYSGGTRIVTGRTIRGLDSSVPSTTPRAVFETERFNPPDTPDMVYEFDFDNDRDRDQPKVLRFYMMNGFRGTSEPGERVFDVEVNGNVALRDVDLSDRFGHQIGGMLSVRVRGGQDIRIVFKRRIQAPLVNAIEILAVDDQEPPPVSHVLYRVNAGGPRIESIDDGPDWLSDEGFFSGGTRIVTGRTIRGLDSSVPSTTTRAVFETERFNPPDTPDMVYTFNVPRDTVVDVKLHMMNGFRGTSEPGERVFDVEINGDLVLEDVDLSREFGHQIGGMRSVRVRSDDRHLRIVFKRRIQAPLINAIEIAEADDDEGPPIVDINPRRSLIETNTTVTEGFNLRHILQRIAENSGLTSNPVRHYQQLIDAYNSRVVTPGAQACTGTLNGFPLECDRLEGEQLNTIDNWFVIALVNRLDLAPANGDHCGQQRIILANNTDIGNGRMFIIIEAQIPNPNRSCGVEGCRAIADFWAELSEIGSPQERQRRLLAAFLDGEASLLENGFGPFMSADLLGPSGGQIRTNNFNSDPWTLREFSIEHNGRNMRVVPAPVADSPHGQLWDDTSRIFARRPQCRDSILDAIADLMTDNPSRMSFPVDVSCRDAESPNDGSQDYRAHLSNGRVDGFRSEIVARIQELDPDSRLTPEDIANRAQFTESCIGCHEEAIGKDLGNGVDAPFSLGFVHVDEFFDEDCGDGTDCFVISLALEEVFLPHRKTVIERFLAAPRTCRSATGVASGLTLGGQSVRIQH
ncbi:MAG: hypothetical protein ETSY1_28965 [Candidatus Entotheonella factor]|uniref:Malectin domain-containing protein n=1 Tax=Entotheonella factor TaxID=1429438 RepID=W4LDS6_ENTF1|nr:MAG: hypothetical protein ETSY1_28965 [Candidatus Entotheonella factor]